MNGTLAITIDGRALRGVLEIDDEAILLTSDEAEWETFLVLPVAIRQVLDRAATKLNLVDSTGGPDHRALSTKILENKLALQLEGPERELKVVQLYLWQEFNLPWETDSIACSVNALSEPSVYSTRGADISIRPLERLARDGERVTEVLKKCGEEGQSSKKGSREGAVWTLLDRRRLTLAVVGDTGAGKSTFLNALVGRPDLLPHDTDPMTAIPTILEHSPSGDCFEVSLLSKAKRDVWIAEQLDEARVLHHLLAHPDLAHQINHRRWSRLTKHWKRRDWVKTKLGTYVPPAANEQIRQRQKELLAIVEQIPRHLDAAAGSQSIHEKNLGALWEYLGANNPKRRAGAGPNLWPAFADHVTVSLTSPVLKYLTLIDTPGFKDPVAARVRRTRDLLTEVNGWLLLVHGESRATTDVDYTLKQLRQHAHVPDGVLVNTKIDLLKDRSRSDELRTLNELLKWRRDQYTARVERWSACAALAAEYLPASLPMSDSDVEDLMKRWSQAPEGGPEMLRRWMPLPPFPMGKKERGAIRLDIEERVEEQRDVALWTAVRDISTELSGLLGVVREVSELVEDNLISEHVKLGRDQLVVSLDQALATRRADMVRWQNQLETDDQRGTIESQKKALRKEIGAISADRKKTLRKFSKARRRLEKSIGKSVDHAAKKGEDLFPSLSKSVAKQANKAQSGKLWGEFSVSLSVVVDPLVATCNALLSEFAEEVANDVTALSPARSEDVRLAIKKEQLSFKFEGKTTVRGTEKFVEWWDDTARPRIVKDATARAKQILKQITGEAGTFESRLTRVLDSAMDVVEEEEVQLTSRIDGLEDRWNQLASDLEALGQGELPRKTLERRKAKSVADIKALESVRIALSKI